MAEKTGPGSGRGSPDGRRCPLGPCVGRGGRDRAAPGTAGRAGGAREASSRVLVRTAAGPADEAAAARSRGRACAGRGRGRAARGRGAGAAGARRLRAQARGLGLELPLVFEWDSLPLGGREGGLRGRPDAFRRRGRRPPKRL